VKLSVLPLVFAFGCVLPATSETITVEGLSVAIWRPASASPAPLVLFSHGFHGCHTQSLALTEGLAAAGYLVAAPNHADAACGGDGAALQTPFAQPELWTDQTYADRADDLARLLLGLSSAGLPIDFARVALVGHSLGGYTVLGTAGAWPHWRLPGLSAVLALSPYCQPFTFHAGALAGMGVPIMYQGGTRDLGITPSVKRAGGCYDQTASPAYFVEFRGAGHFAWTNAQTEHDAIILRYALAFLDKYVRGLRTRPDLRVLGVSDLRVK
jgi:predicted dienelactone hydrolase